MAYWIGAVMFLIGAVFLVNGLRHRSGVRAERVRHGYAADDDTLQQPASPTSAVAIMGDVVPPIILFVLGILGVKASFLFMVMGGEMFTIVDLAGFLALLAGYGAWMWMHSKFRYRETVGAAQPAEPAATQAAETARAAGAAPAGDAAQEPAPVVAAEQAEAGRQPRA